MYETTLRIITTKKTVPLTTKDDSKAYWMGTMTVVDGSYDARIKSRLAGNPRISQ